MYRRLKLSLLLGRDDGCTSRRRRFSGSPVFDLWFVPRPMLDQQKHHQAYQSDRRSDRRDEVAVDASACHDEPL